MSNWIEIYCTLSAILPSPITIFPINSLRRLLELSQDLLSLGTGGVEVSNHVESTLRKRVTLSGHDALEGVDGLWEVDELTLDTGENL
jgi:hypothetical protein